MWVLDVETTIFAKGNPYSLKNKLVVVGLLNIHTGERHVWYEEDFDKCREFFHTSKSLIGFNIKFDMGWIYTTFGRGVLHRVWDEQLWEFLDSNQRDSYPSLDRTCIKRSLGKKIDVIKEKYWSQGIDTDQIPREELTEYLLMDLELTAKLYKWQSMQKRSWINLFHVQCEDLLILQEAEQNGIKLDQEKIAKEAAYASQRIKEIEQEISEGRTLPPQFKFSSTDHLSALLFGGTIVVEDRVPVGVYKSGQKVGHTRYKIVRYEYEYPRLLKPSDKYALKKEGVWSVAEEHLVQCKGNKKVKELLSLLSERSGLEKLLSTYYTGFNNTIEKMGWPSDMIHGQFNQCVAVTGRLSATNPNQQNIPPQMKRMLISRYDY